MSTAADRAQAQRDLNPHAPARAAMWLWSAEYARSGLGSMRFWDRLDEHRKGLARQAAREIKSAPEDSFT